jgi:hypothetical protein
MGDPSCPVMTWRFPVLGIAPYLFFLLVVGIPISE